MDITWMGRRAFGIKGKDVTVLTDPYNNIAQPASKGPAIRAVTFSSRAGAGGILPVAGSAARIISGPGEYETANIFITGVGTLHETRDPEGHLLTGKNTVYAIELEGIVICHLGDLQQALTSDQVERIGDVTVLMAPVGTPASFRASVDTIALLEPKLVLPMDYETTAAESEGPPEAPSAGSGQGLARFLKEMGAQSPEPQKRLHITASTLPQQTQVAVLEPTA